MPTQSSSSALMISEYVIWNDVAEDFVLFDERNGSYHALNKVASSVWRGMAKGTALPVLIEDLAYQYAAPCDRVRADVEAFIAVALRLGLLTSEQRDS
jgi:hypothetical protein